MATQTTNYHFPKYEADDLPNLLDEYNEFADLADAAINNAMMTATNAGTAAQNAKTAADAASAKADDVEETVNTVSAQVVTAQNTAEQALSLAQTNESDIAGLDTQVETANQSIAALQSGKAPTNHASSSGTYGTGTATNYGHVRLSDSPSSTGATGGIAATPLALLNLQDAVGTAQLIQLGTPGANHASAMLCVNEAIKLCTLRVSAKQYTPSAINPESVDQVDDPGIQIPVQYQPTSDIRALFDINLSKQSNTNLWLQGNSSTKPGKVLIAQYTLQSPANPIPLTADCIFSWFYDAEPAA